MKRSSTLRRLIRPMLPPKITWGWLSALFFTLCSALTTYQGAVQTFNGHHFVALLLTLGIACGLFALSTIAAQGFRRPYGRRLAARGRRGRFQTA